MSYGMDFEYSASRHHPQTGRHLSVCGNMESEPDRVPGPPRKRIVSYGMGFKFSALRHGKSTGAAPGPVLKTVCVYGRGDRHLGFLLTTSASAESTAPGFGPGYVISGQWRLIFRVRAR